MRATRSITTRLGSGLAGAAVLAAVLTGCGTDEQTTADSTTPPATTTVTDESPTTTVTGEPSPSFEPEPGVSDEPPFPADTAADTAEPSGDAMLVLTEIRSGVHEGFDRVVLEFEGPGTPGWTAQYTDQASRQGQGTPITVLGTTMLDIIVTGTGYPEAGVSGVPAGAQPGPGTVALEVFNDGTFEGQTHVVLGVSAERPFRVITVADPPRVIIDIRH